MRSFIVRSVQRRSVCAFALLHVARCIFYQHVRARVFAHDVHYEQRVGGTLKYARFVCRFIPYKVCYGIALANHFEAAKPSVQARSAWRDANLYTCARAGVCIQCTRLMACTKSSLKETSPRTAANVCCCCRCATSGADERARQRKVHTDGVV